MKLLKNLAGLPLFFKVFGSACGLMFGLAIYSLTIELFNESRIFLYTGLTGYLVLSLITLATSNRNLKDTGALQLFSLVLLFLLLPLFLALPTWIILPSINFFDAYLDMVSAFTTTGLPILEKELLSKPIHLWRALVGWFGGGLIWIAAFVILLPTNFEDFEVFSNKRETTNLKRKLTLNERSLTLIKVSQKLIPIYVGLTFVLWGLLTALGTDGYTSLIRSLSIISTSGISGPKSFQTDGAGFFGELVIIIFLFVGLSHNIINFLNKKIRLKEIVSDIEIRVGLFIILLATMILSFQELTYANSFINLSEPIISGVKLIWGNFFTAFSFITTNGYVSKYWSGAQSSSDLSHIIIIFSGLCLFGGGVATTAGGIKLLRISILFSAFSNETAKLLHPSSIVATRGFVKGGQISVFMAWIFFMLFIVSLAVLTILFSMFGLLFEEALIIAIACLTTAGPIIEVFGLEKILIYDLSLFSKVALVVGMVLGRLEILVVLSLIVFGFRRD